MKVRIHYDANEHQQAFHDDDVSKFLHLSGGFGSGKTHGLCKKVLKLSWLNRPYAGGLVAPSYNDFKNDVLPEMEKILDENRLQYTYHKTDHYFKFPWTKGRLYVATAEKRLRGPNWSYAAINEVTLIPLVRYREVVGRVRVKGARCPQIASSGTPEGIASEYYEVFVEKPWNGARVIYGDTRNNLKNLAAGYYEQLENSFDRIMLDAYAKGLWINMTGNRFYYSYDPNRNDDPKIGPPVNERTGELEMVHVTLDFNVEPMAANIWGYDGMGVQAFDEITLNDADSNKMALALIARGYTPDRTVLYPDPSGKNRSTKGLPDIQIFKNHGFQNIRYRSKAPGFRERQLNVNNLLEKGVIRINPVKCPELKKDLVGVEQDRVTLEKIKLNPKRTHHSDGMDYMLDILFPYSGRKPSARIVTHR